MAFIHDSDIKAFILTDELSIISSSDANAKSKVINASIETCKGYIRQRYDCDQVFADYTEGADPDPRNATLVMHLCDIIIYNLLATEPDFTISQMRIDRHEQAKEWLKDIQKGTVDPDFPTYDTEEETDVQNPIRYGSGTKLNSTW